MNSQPALTQEEKARRDQEWQTFLSWPFSARTRNFFENAKIKSIEQLVRMPRTEIRKYRGVGKKSIAELSAALEHFGSSLANETDAPVITPDALTALEREQIELEFRLREVKDKIRIYKESIPPKQSQTSIVMGRWLVTRDCEAVAKDLSLSNTEVRRVILDAYYRKFKKGELDDIAVVDDWEELKDAAAVCKKYDIPDFVLQSVVRRVEERRRSPRRSRRF